jgi:stage II sporulation protein R
MVKRFSIRPYLYTAFAIIMLLVSWESNRNNAAIASAAIPDEAIRLRILANSDAPQDQAVKRQIRDAIMQYMNEWVEMPESIGEARDAVGAHLEEIDALIGDLLRKNGFTYSHSVELGVVPFPAKMYGDQVYPDGDYEALRIVLGKGEGQNWWCVLFPPLCFVNVEAGNAVAKPQVDVATVAAAAVPVAAVPEKQPEVRFFVWDVLQKLSGMIKAMFTV